MTQDQHMVSEATNQAEVNAYQCPSCSGPMVFNPQKATLACEYCDFEKVLEPEGELTRYDFFATESEANHVWGSQITALHCQSCGAHTHVDQKSVSITCPFCGSKHVQTESTIEGISPHAVVPFKLSRKEAYDRFNRWIGKRFFAKKAIKDVRDEERLKGIYIPYWHFNVDTYSHYHCQIGYNYTVTVTKHVMENGKSVAKQVQETRIRWESKAGVMPLDFTDLLSNASEQFNTSKINALEPFDFREAQPYDPGYLSGFIAERYSVSLSDGFESLKSEIQNGIISAIQRKYHGDHIRHARLNTEYQSVDYQHILLPVWLSTFLYKGKTYQFGINGQTGEVQGNYPLDWLKISIVVAIILALVAAYLLYQNANGGYSTLLQLYANILKPIA